MISRISLGMKTNNDVCSAAVAMVPYLSWTLPKNVIRVSLEVEEGGCFVWHLCAQVESVAVLDEAVVDISQQDVKMVLLEFTVHPLMMEEAFQS
jgi:hypothetical protein